MDEDIDVLWAFPEVFGPSFLNLVFGVEFGLDLPDGGIGDFVTTCFMDCKVLQHAFVRPDGDVFNILIWLMRELACDTHDSHAAFDSMHV